MKQLFWIGLTFVILGLLSFVVPIPHTEREGMSAGGMSVGIQTQHSETVSPLISAILLLGGAGLMISSRKALRM